MMPTLRNDPSPFDLGVVEDCRVNRSAVERRAATLPARRSVKKDWQAAWLLRAITCLDLTTLAGDDTPGTVQRLCAKARRPLGSELVDALGVQSFGIRVGAVCVYPALVSSAVAALDGSGIPVASVAAGFPAGQTRLRERLAEIERAVADGAQEIDIVIQRPLVLEGRWRDLYDEIRTMRETCGDALLKTILATGELGTLTNVAKASTVCLMAGADFIKTSTGKETVNATLPVGLVMTRAIRDHHERTGQKPGFKPAGGIRTAKQSLDWLALIKDELGNDWLNADRFRIGASGLLTDIERQLSYHVTGRYSSVRYHPMP